MGAKSNYAMQIHSPNVYSGSDLRPTNGKRAVYFNPCIAIKRRQDHDRLTCPPVLVPAPNLQPAKDYFLNQYLQDV